MFLVFLFLLFLQLKQFRKRRKFFIRRFTHQFCNDFHSCSVTFQKSAEYSGIHLITRQIFSHFFRYFGKQFVSRFRKESAGNTDKQFQLGMMLPGQVIYQCIKGDSHVLLRIGLRIRSQLHIEIKHIQNISLNFQNRLRNLIFRSSLFLNS